MPVFSGVLPSTQLSTVCAAKTRWGYYASSFSRHGSLFHSEIMYFFVFLDAWLDHRPPPYCWKSWRDWTHCLCCMDKSISSCPKRNRHTKADASRQRWTHGAHPQVFLPWESQMWLLGTSVTSSALSCLYMVQVLLFTTTARSGVTAAFGGGTDVAYSLCCPASKGDQILLRKLLIKDIKDYDLPIGVNWSLTLSFCLCLKSRMWFFISLPVQKNLGVPIVHVDVWLIHYTLYKQDCFVGCKCPVIQFHVPMLLFCGKGHLPYITNYFVHFCHAVTYFSSLF